MRKRVFALTLILVFLLSMTAYAAEPKNIAPIYPSLSFSGTTANCSVSVTEAGADISVTLTLYRGWSVIGSWSGSGEDYVKVSGSAAVKDGLEYRLVATGTIDGVAFTSAEVVGTC